MLGEELLYLLHYFFLFLARCTYSSIYKMHLECMKEYWKNRPTWSAHSHFFSSASIYCMFPKLTNIKDGYVVIMWVIQKRVSLRHALHYKNVTFWRATRCVFAKNCLKRPKKPVKRSIFGDFCEKPHLVVPKSRTSGFWHFWAIFGQILLKNKQKMEVPDLGATRCGFHKIAKSSLPYS